MLVIAVFDMAEPEGLEEGFAMLPLGADGLLLLSLEDGDEVVEEALESAGAAGLLQPSRAKDK
ncbi:MAG: hypothetical protein WBQ68_08055 [Terriglobales bacterium]